MRMQRADCVGIRFDRFALAASVVFAMILLIGVRGAQGELVTFSYQAQVATIVGTPFDLDAGSDLASPVTGSFTFNSDTRDQDFKDPHRGQYAHDPALGGVGGGGFMAVVNRNSGPTFTITGSSFPLVTIEDFAFVENFRFRDGPDVFNPGGIMQLDGIADANLRLDFIFRDTTASTFPSDALPTSPAPINLSPSLPHTFILKELNTGDYVLLRFSQVTQVPEPSALFLSLLGMVAVVLVVRRKR